MSRELSLDDLFKRCDDSHFDFRTTNDVLPLDGIIGQERALDSIDFGLNLASTGFNIYVLGDSGTGKVSAIRSFISKKAEQEKVPSDWCYVHNFRDPAEPLAISLEPGRGDAFRKDMEELVASLKVEIPKIFDSKEFKQQSNMIVEGFQSRQKDLFASLEREAGEKGFKVQPAVGGFSIVVTGETGDPLTEEEFKALDEEKANRIQESGKQIQEKIDDMRRVLKTQEKATREKMRDLGRKAALSVLEILVEDIRAQYDGSDGKVSPYLECVKEDILDNIDDFKTQVEEAAPPPVPSLKMPKKETEFHKYFVNVIVNNGGRKGSPCVIESNPTYYNLFGRMEHKFQSGAAFTDFTMIKAGALHKANGGYLVINALDLVRNLISYDALKRAIRNCEVKIEDVWEQYRSVPTAMMKPGPIPLDVKVILIGNPEIYYLLYNLDEEFRELFKVKADFDSRMERSEENIRKYAAFVATKARGENLLPFDPSGVGKVVEFGSRLAGDQKKLSSKFSDISNLIRESHYWAAKDSGSFRRSRRKGDRGEDLPTPPGRGPDAGGDGGGDADRGDLGGEEGTDQRPCRSGHGGSFLREAVADHGDRVRRKGGGHKHREGDEAFREDPRKSDAHPHELSGQQIRRTETDQSHRVDYLRTALRDDRRGQRDLRGALRAPERDIRDPGQAGYLRNGFHGPERKRATDRRCERKDRRILRSLQPPGVRRFARRHHPETQRQESDAEEGRRRGDREKGIPDICH
jgi:predicted ATP-dependent protease